MKTVAIIAEYNPFHNGHLYQINQVKKETNADCLVVIMSGNYVQRGTPAMVDKYTRTKLALCNGVDLVFELPVYFSTASAELFAFGAVNILHKLGNIDYLCFGSECGDVPLLNKIAQVLIEEPEEYKQMLKCLLKTGVTYPTARNHALIQYLGDGDDIAMALQQPNNILGIEYIKAIKKLNSSIIPITIKRYGSGYHEKELNHTFCSATALRNYYEGDFMDKTFLSIDQFVPMATKQMLDESYQKLFPITADDFTSFLYYRLQLETKDSLLQYLDVTEELANRIISELDYRNSYSEFAKQIKTKQYTYTRIERALLHIILGITKEKMNQLLEYPMNAYVRLLGFRSGNTSQLRIMQKLDNIPIITKVADAKQSLSKTAWDIFDTDIKATHLYNHIVYQKFHTVINEEYKSGPIRYELGIE